MDGAFGTFSPAVEELLESLARQLRLLVLSEGIDDMMLWAEISLFSVHGNVWGALIKQNEQFTHHALAVTHTGHPQVIKNNPLYEEDTNLPPEFSISQVLDKLKMDLRHEGMYEVYWYPGGNSPELINILGGATNVGDAFKSWWSIVQEKSKCGKPEGFVFFPVVLSTMDSDQLVGGIFFALSNKAIKSRMGSFYRLRTLFHLVVAQNFARDLGRYAASATVGNIASFIQMTLEYTKKVGVDGWFEGSVHDDVDSLQRDQLKAFFSFSEFYPLDAFKGMFQADVERRADTSSDKQYGYMRGLKCRHPVYHDLNCENARLALPKKMVEQVLSRFYGSSVDIAWEAVGATDYFALPCVPGWAFLASLADFMSKEVSSKKLKMFQKEWGRQVLAGVAVELNEGSENAKLSHLHAAITNSGNRARGTTTRNIEDVVFARLVRSEYNFESDYDNEQKIFARHIVRGSELPIVNTMLAGKNTGKNEIFFTWFGPRQVRI